MGREMDRFWNCRFWFRPFGGDSASFLKGELLFRQCSVGHLRHGKSQFPRVSMVREYGLWQGPHIRAPAVQIDRCDTANRSGCPLRAFVLYNQSNSMPRCLISVGTTGSDN